MRRVLESAAPAISIPSYPLTKCPRRRHFFGRVTASRTSAPEPPILRKQAGGHGAHRLECSAELTGSPKQATTGCEGDVVTSSGYPPRYWPQRALPVRVVRGCVVQDWSSHGPFGPTFWAAMGIGSCDPRGAVRGRDQQDTSRDHPGTRGGPFEADRKQREGMWLGLRGPRGPVFRGKGPQRISDSPRLRCSRPNTGEFLCQRLVPVVLWSPTAECRPFAHLISRGTSSRHRSREP